jgi:hypothetical protein
MWRVFAVALVPLLGGCPEHGTSPDPATQQGRCSLLEGKNFRSRTLQECGLTPEGPGQCFWRLQFDANTPDDSRFFWTHSDTGEAGTVICNGADLVTVVGGGPATMPRGRFDGPTQILTWDDIGYEKEAGGEDPPPDPKDPPVVIIDAGF